MALDVGARRIGVALSDPLRVTARPLLTLPRVSPSEDARRILELAVSEGAELLVVGLPRHLDGRPGDTLQEAQALARSISELSPIALDWCDERLSSKEAEELMAEAGVPPQRRRKRRDEFAAAVILRRYIEESA